MNQEPLSIYVCPVHHTPLVPADAQLITRINRAIAAGRVKNVSGRLVDQPLGGGMLRDDRAVLYPICDGIPVLLADEAIPLDQVGM
ncbi:MAG: Trm112 family protein [Thermoguttaceae bacterium]